MRDPSPGAIDRRGFFSACALLGTALAGCSNLTDRTRVASTFIIDPPAGEYMPALRALIRLILPFDRADFPLAPREVEKRLLRMFPLEEERMFLGLQRTLVYFNQLELIPHAAQVLIDEERKAADCPGRISRGEFRRRMRESIGRETEVFGSFVDSLPRRARRFTDLDPAAQRDYFDLWCTSELVVKRGFAGGLRYIVLVAAYSDESVWPVLGYEGPFVPRVRRNEA
jgi:hypothetical protein